MTMNFHYFERLIYCFEALFWLNVFMMSKKLMLHRRFGDLPFNSCSHICENEVVLEPFPWRGKRDHAVIRKCSIFNLFVIYFIFDTVIHSFILFARSGYLWTLNWMKHISWYCWKGWVVEIIVIDMLSTWTTSTQWFNPYLLWIGDISEKYGKLKSLYRKRVTLDSTWKIIIT